VTGGGRTSAEKVFVLGSKIIGLGAPANKEWKEATGCLGRIKRTAVLSTCLERKVGGHSQGPLCEKKLGEQSGI